MGLFSSTQETHPEWISQFQDIKERMFVFFDKLEIKMKELCDVAIPELNETHRTDDDMYKRSYGRMLSGIKGQIQNIRDKARTTYEEKVTDFYRQIDNEISVQSPHHNTLMDFRNDIADRYNAFEDIANQWNDDLDATGVEDLEIKYKAILDEFDAIKDKFACKQCGGGITIEKIFFINAFITCSHCQTQNTFEPSTQAMTLPYLGRALAEQRTEHLKKVYEDEVSMERTLYHERHKIDIGHFDDDNKQAVADKNRKLEALTQQRLAVIKNAPILYKQYLRAMFDEWNKITPDLAAENNKTHDNWLAEFMRNHS